jgi:hypothetical protein
MWRTSTIPRYVKRPSRTGEGFTSIRAGQYLITWVTELNEEALGRMAARALENKSGRSKCGPVTVRIQTTKILGSELDTEKQS